MCVCVFSAWIFCRAFPPRYVAIKFQKSATHYTDAAYDEASLGGREDSFHLFHVSRGPVANVFSD